MPLDTTITSIDPVTDMRYSHDADNENAWVQVNTFAYAGQKFTLNLILPLAAPKDAKWLLGSIADSTGAWIWSYKQDVRAKKGFTGRIYLELLEGRWVTIFVTNRHQIAEVIPLAELIGGVKVALSPRESALLKRQAASIFGASVSLTKAETEAVDFRLSVIDRVSEKEKDESRSLVKVVHGATGHLVGYRIVIRSKDGEEVEHLGPITLADARMKFGRVPVAPPGDGRKTNVPPPAESKQKKEKKRR